MLDAEAKKLFARYRELPTEQLYAVIEIAANADPKLAAQLRTDLDAEHDPVIHSTMVEALSQLRDPMQHRAMLESIVADLSERDDLLFACAQLAIRKTTLAFADARGIDRDARASVATGHRAHGQLHRAKEAARAVAARVVDGEVVPSRA